MRRRLAVLAAAASVLLAGCEAPRPSTMDDKPTLGPVPSATPGAACLTPWERTGTVRFRSGNGALLAGVVFGTGRVAVVFGHSNNTDLCDWVPYARVLAGQGYTALSIDLNGYGASQPSAGVPVDPRYDEDYSAAVTLLRGRGHRVVFLVGEVIAGIAAVKAATEISPPVAGVVDVSSPAEALSIDGVAEAATRAPEHDLVVVTSTGRETMLFDPALEPRAGEVRARVAQFLERYGGPVS